MIAKSKSTVLAAPPPTGTAKPNTNPPPPPATGTAKPNTNPPPPPPTGTAKPNTNPPPPPTIAKPTLSTIKPPPPVTLTSYDNAWIGPTDIPNPKYIFHLLSKF